MRSSRNTGRRRRGRAPAVLPVPYDILLDSYVAQLAHAPLAADNRTKYAGRVRRYLRRRGLPVGPATARSPCCPTTPAYA